MREPLLWPALAVFVGIGLADAAALASREALLPLCALPLLALAAARWARRWTLPCLALALAALAAFRLAQERERPWPELDATAQEWVVVEGCVVEPPRLSGDREQVLMEIGPQARARVTVTPRDGEPPVALSYGQRIEVEGRFRPPRNAGNPGAWDRVRQWHRQQVYWGVSVPSRQVRVLPGSCGSAWRAALYRLRSAILDRIDRLPNLDPYGRAVLAATLVGDASRLESAWEEPYRRTGTFHVLVVSGLQVTVLAGLVLALFRLCPLPPWAALLGAALAVWGYALLVGLQAPVVRAAGAATLFLVGRWWFRRARPLNLLAAVALALLLWDPEQLFDASFQLSFASVGVLLTVASPLQARWTGPWRNTFWHLDKIAVDARLEPLTAQRRVEWRLAAETVRLATRVPERVTLTAVSWVGLALTWAVNLALVSAVLQVGLVVPMVTLFHRVSLTAALANVPVGPLLTAVVPAGLLAVLTGHGAAAGLCHWLIGGAKAAVEACANWEPGWRVPAPPLLLATSVAVTLVAWALLLRLRPRWHAVAGLAALASSTVVLWHPFAPRTGAGEMELTAIDVGQGDSLLVVLPHGKTMLVDGGGVPRYGRSKAPIWDVGEQVVSPYLWSRSIQRLDVVALTHAHADHMDGLAAILANFRPRELWVGAMPDSAAWHTLRETARRFGVRVRALHAGERPLGGAVEVLAPAGDYVAGTTARNNDSLVLRMAHGRHTFLLTGDAERAIEYELVAGGQLGKVDVLKVGHHGSKTSSTLEFLETVRPAVSVISVGLDNSYRLPHPETVERLREHGAVLRTDRGGLVSIRSDGKRLRWEPFRWAPEPSSLLRAAQQP